MDPARRSGTSGGRGGFRFTETADHFTDHLITSATAAPDTFPSGGRLAAEIHMPGHGQTQRIPRRIHHRPGQLPALPRFDASTGAGTQRKKATQKSAQKTIHDHKPEMG